jgi:hypothetical protein
VSTKPVMGTTPTGRRRNRSWPEALKREIVAASYCQPVTGAVLNHISGSKGGIVGLYQKHQYTEERRKAWG